MTDYAYENAFITNNYGYSSAVSMIIFLILIVFSYVIPIGLNSLYNAVMESSEGNAYNKISSCKIMFLPGPTVAVTAMMVLIYVWNEYIFAINFMTGEHTYTLSVPYAYSDIGICKTAPLFISPLRFYLSCLSFFGSVF